MESVGCCTGLRLHHLCLLYLCVGALLTQHVQATLIASSKITYCKNTTDYAINCTKNMVVTLTVEAEQKAGEESLVFLNSAVDETVPTDTAANTTKTVKIAPISITTSRSAVRYRYPIFYVQNYNAKPYEATVKGRLLNQCNAEFNANTATCGIAYDSAKKPIPYSQGFCCDCSMCQTLGFCEPGARANRACNIFDEYTTASCLRFGQRWYSGYTIGTYATWFTLNVTVSRNSTAGSGDRQTVVKQSVVLQLSPSVLGDTAGDRWGVSARLVGSFAPTDQPLDLTSHMLFAPALPLADARVRAGAAEWMLLPNTFVTMDGKACNKVGVSYEAFASQGNRCNLNPGSCLSSQLEDYRASDLERIAVGKKTHYMATGYGDFDLERVVNTTGMADGVVSPYISYVVTSPVATMIVLTVDADDLEYIVGVAAGKILYAALNNETVEANTRDGVLSVVVQNVATVTGRLVVGVEKCTSGVFPVAAQIISLAAHQQLSLQFNMYMQGATAAGSASCTVVVRNAEEVVTDFRVVSWVVVAPGFNNGTQGGTAGGGGGSSKESSAVSCDACTVMNIFCAVKRRCWALILLDLVMYLVIAVIIFCVFWFRRIICCCCYLKRTHHGHHHHHRHHRRDRSNSCSRSSSSDGGGGRSHSPTREDSRGDRDARRQSRSRIVLSPSTSRGQSQHPRNRHSGRGSSRRWHDIAVLPRPPPMMYTVAPVYAGSGAIAPSAVHFSPPSRVPPPSSPPPHEYLNFATPSRHPTPLTFSSALSGECAAFPNSPSLPPAASFVSNGRARPHSPAPMPPPCTSPFSARGTREPLHT